MCIALPLGPLNKKPQSKLWRFISSTPLNMLLFSAAFQFFALIFLNLVYQRYGTGIAFSGLENYSFYLLTCLFWIFPFVSYAFLMNFYPRLCQQGEVEYLQYAALNTLGNFNLILFYIASIYFNSLINIVLTLQLFVLIYAFKPIWQIGFWAGKSKTLLVKTINFSSSLIALSLLMTLVGALFDISFLSSYAPYLSLFQLLVLGLTAPQLIKQKIVNSN